MSLYRTWRPRSFADLVGQDAVVRTLSQALTTGRFVHAYIFSGPRGSGKTSAAKIFARCITCINGPTDTPDNTCDHCLAVLSGTALDVVEIDAASNRGIDEIRALRDAVKFAPAIMRKKVYIIDEAHMLTKEGANAFLKTLEEPPPHAVFILATTAPEALPVTILSRCQRYAFRRIPTPVMLERMRMIAQAESIAIEDAALNAIAYRADGGLRDALTMLEQVASFANGHIDLATVEAAFGAGGQQHARMILQCFLVNDAVGVLQAIETASESGTDISNVTRSLIAEIRNLVIARVSPDILSKELVYEDVERITAQAQMIPQARALRALRVLADALGSARTSNNPRVELESAMLRLTLQSEDPTLEALGSRIRQLEEQLLNSGPFNITAPLPIPRRQDISDSSTIADLPVDALPPIDKTDRTKQASRQGETVRSRTIVPSDATIAGGTAKKIRQEQKAPDPFISERREAGEHSSEYLSQPTAPPGRHVATTESDPQNQPTLQKVRALWPNVQARAEAKIASLRGPLSRATITTVEGWTIGLQLTDEYNAGFLRDRVGTLEVALSEVLGAKCRVAISVASGTPRHTAKKPTDDPSEESLGLLDYALKRLSIPGDE